MSQLATEMRFQELLDKPRFLISKNKINLQQGEENYGFGDDFSPLSPGTSIESKRTLLRQLDKLKEKQQKLISDRIKILEQRMKIEGYNSTEEIRDAERTTINPIQKERSYTDYQSQEAGHTSKVESSYYKKT